MKYCDTDRSPDLTLGKLISSQKCVTQPASRLRTGARTAIPEGTTSSHDSWLADRTTKNSPTHNTAQFSKTTALLGAAGKISTTCYWRQPALAELL
jgi:hypothetical protein